MHVHAVDSMCGQAGWGTASVHSERSLCRWSHYFDLPFRLVDHISGLCNINKASCMDVYIYICIYIERYVYACVSRIMRT